MSTFSQLLFCNNDLGHNNLLCVCVCVGGGEIGLIVNRYDVRPAIVVGVI